ncbi:hypothetical protein AB0F59_26475 [Micromonospora lupini]
MSRSVAEVDLSPATVVLLDQVDEPQRVSAAQEAYDRESPVS